MPLKGPASTVEPCTDEKRIARSRTPIFFNQRNSCSRARTDCRRVHFRAGSAAFRARERKAFNGIRAMMGPSLLNGVLSDRSRPASVVSAVHREDPVYDGMAEDIPPAQFSGMCRRIHE